MNRERRQSPRIDLIGELQGHAMVLDEPVEIKQMSRGGLTIATRFPFKVGSEQDLQLTLGAESTTVRGRVIHLRVTFEHDETRYVCGIQFLQVTAAVSTWLGQFVARLPIAVQA
jgi:hypothetical protein